MLIVLLALLAVRFFMPYVILHYANKKLASLDGYYGHTNDINVAMIRGAYVLRDVYINAVDEKTGDTTEFFKSPRVDISIEWSALFDGKIVSEIEFEKPYIAYTLHKTVGGGKQLQDSTDFIKLIKDFTPLDINRFTVIDGELHYKDHTRSPAVDVPMTDLDAEGTGLTNQPTDTLLPAEINATANLYDGRMTLGVKLDPLNKFPTYDLNATLTETNLTHMNDFLKAYGNFDVHKGTLSTYIEMAARDGKFKGYVKPIIKDLDVVQLNKEEGPLPQIAWEAFVGALLEIFQNQPHDQFATKVPVEGRFRDPRVGVIQAIFAMLRNAFIESLKPSLDESIEISDVDQGVKIKEKREKKEKRFGKDKKDDGKEKRRDATDRDRNKDDK
ncbi:MAG TPA: DUF748 domain-containing protein [Bacteroidia bacterium]|nr:DUF748 domain-containing protein [Bacteroidia bacterium]